MRPILIFFLCIFLYSDGLFSQQSEPVFRHFTTEDGLPSSEVYYTLQDSKGNMWFSTDRGIARFDGYEFRTYTYKNGLTDNTVFRLFEDKRGRLWMYTYTGRLFYLDDEKIRPFKFNNLLAAKTLSRVPLNFYIDSIGNASVVIRDLGELLVDTNGKLTSNYIYRKGNGVHYLIDEKSDGTLITGVFSPPSQIATVNILHLQNSNTGISRDTISVASEHKDRFAVIRVDDGRMVFGIGKTLYERSGDKIRIIKTFNGSIFSIYKDKSGKIWTSTEDGVFVFDNDSFNGKVSRYLEKNAVTLVRQDKEGGYWFTTLDNGVYYMPGYGIECIRFNSGLFQKPISLASDFKSGIYAGCWNGAVAKIHDRALSLVYHPGPGVVDLPISNLTSFKDDERIFLSRHMPGYLLNNKLYPFDYTRVLGLKSNFLKNKYGEIFCSGSAVVFKLKGDSVINIANTYHRINCLAEGEGHDILIGTNRGVYLMKKNINKLILYKNEFANMRVDDIKWMKDALFFATKGNGVMILNKDKFVKIDESAGLCSDLVNKIYINKNIAWCTTNKGISRIKFNTTTGEYSLTNIRTTEGLLSDEINDITFLKDTIYVATNSGISFFSADIDFVNHTPPAVSVNSILVNNSDTLLQNGIRFSHDKNDIHIHFSGVSFRSHEKIGYQYRLIKGDDTVKSFTTNRQIEFLSLSPGNYRFEVMAKNNSGIWSSSPAVFNFVIRPAWWQTWWFRLIIFLIAASVLFLIYKLRIRIIKRTYDIEKRQANLQLTALRSQMNPHFIFNVMNSIRNYMQNNDMVSAEKYLTSFSRLVRYTLDNSEVQEVSLDEELKALRSYTELEMQRFEHGFKFSINCDSNIDMTETMLPSLLLQPFVENAIKHGISTLTEGGEITIDIHKTGDVILIAIQDNGKGRAKYPVNGSHISHGTSLTFERINAYNTAYNKSIKAKIIFMNDETSSMTGTRVEVEI